MNNQFFNALSDYFKAVFNNNNVLPIVAKDRNHLNKLIEKSIKNHGYKCNLNHIDVSNITDMSGLFMESWFHGDISKWNTSKVENMEMMFHVSKFNGDISRWDISSVKNMEKMFKYSVFNKSISEWKPYNLENEKDMFMGTYASTPYWYGHENKKIRNKAIDMYHLNKNLNQALSVNQEAKNKRIKI